MKKLLLLFAVMLTSVGAWGQDWSYATNIIVGNKITDFTTVADEQQVVFKHVASGNYIVLDAGADADLTSTLSGLCVFTLHKGEGDNEGKFSIESSKEGYYFPEIQHDGDWIDYIMTDSPVFYEFLSTQADGTALGNGQFVVKCSSTSGYFDGQDYSFTAWEGKGGYCKYEVYAVTPYDFTDAYDAFSTGFYTLQCPNKSNVYAKYDGTRITHVANDKKEFVNCVFYFEKGDGNKYTIRLNDGKYLTYKGTGISDQIEIKSATETNDNNKWWQICSGNVNGRMVILPNQSEIGNKTAGFNFSVRYNEDANGALGLWDCDDNNSQWVISPAGAMFTEGKAKIKVQNKYLKKDGDYLKEGSESDFELFTLTKDTEKNRYTIQTSDGTYLTYSATTNGTQVTFASSPTDDNKWWIVECNNGAAYGATNPVDIYPYVDSFDKNNPAWNFAIKVNDKANQAIGLWNAGGDNSYCELFWEIEAVVTDEAENSYSKTYYGVAGFFDPSFSGASGYTLSNQQWNGDQFTSHINFPLPVSKVDGSADNLVLITPFTATNTLKYYVESDNVKVTSTAPTSETADNYQWAIYPYFRDNTFTFVLKNHANQKYVKANKTESTAATSDPGAVTTVEGIDNATYFTLESNCRFKVPNADVRLSVTSSTTSPQDVTVHSGHTGCNTYYAIVSEMVNSWKEGYLSTLGYIGGLPVSYEDDITAVQSYADILSFKVEEIEKVAMTPGYYRIQNLFRETNGVKHMIGIKDGERKGAVGNQSNVNFIWKFETCEDGYKIQAVNIGENGYMATIGTNTFKDFTNGAKYTLHELGSAQWSLKDGHGATLFLTNGGENLINWSGASLNGDGAWYIIPATELDIEVSSAGWATTCLPFDVVLPESLTAYTLTDVSNANETEGTVSLISRAGIKAYEGALLKGDEGTYTLSIEETGSNWDDNLLSGTTVAKDMSTVDGDVYLLVSDGAGSAKLSKLTLADDATDAKKTLAANKAYLNIQASAARSLVFDFGDGEETGIGELEVENGNEKAEIYDLSGRRVQKAQKGMYIVNGIKVIK